MLWVILGYKAKEDADWCLYCVLQQLTQKPIYRHMSSTQKHSVPFISRLSIYIYGGR